jgi:drug/metabolite transporter (DMT)-like permease
VLALGLALGAALAWGTADFLGGLTTRGLPVLTVLVASQGVGLLALGIVVAAGGGGEAPATADVFYGMLAGVALAVALGALYQGMAVGVMSVVSPISAAGAAIPIAFDLVRGDHPSIVQGAGVAAALAGVTLVSRGMAGAAGAGGSTSAGAGLGLLAAAGFGTFFVAIDSAAGSGVVWATISQRAGVVSTVVLALAVVRPPIGVQRRLVVPLFSIGALDLTATMLFAAGTQEGLTSLVSVVASLYPAATIALAFLLLGERLHRVQQAGAVALLAGVALIAGG